MLNRVVLTGRLTRDAELRYTQGGTSVPPSRWPLIVSFGMLKVSVMPTLSTVLSGESQPKILPTSPQRCLGRN